MKEPKSKKQLIIQIVAFCFFFTIFIYGFMGMADQMPLSFLKPVVKIKRGLSIAYHRALLKYEFCSGKNCLYSLKQLRKNADQEIINYCVDYQKSDDTDLAKYTFICILKEGSSDQVDQSLAEYQEKWKDILPFKAVMAGLSKNKNSAKILENYFVNQDMEITDKIYLAQLVGPKASNQTAYIDFLKKVIEEENNGKASDLALDALAAFGSEKDFVQKIHQKRLESGGRHLASAINFFARSSDLWFKENFVKLYNKLDLAGRLSMLDVTPLVCPDVEISQWKKWFMDSNEFKIKEKAFRSIMIYNYSDEKKEVPKLFEDLKLRDSEKETLKKRLKEYEPLDKKVCR